MRIPLTTLALAAGLLAGCADSSPTGPNLADAKPAADVSGSWDWSDVTHIRATPYAAGIIGVEPEGHVTHIACPASGTMTLVQTGDTFSGSTTQQPGICTTRGGQTAQAPFPPSADIIDGEVRGRSVRFTLDTGDFPCHLRGSLRVAGGATERWHMTGACDLPPELGKDKIRDFIAVRP